METNINAYLSTGLKAAVEAAEAIMEIYNTPYDKQLKQDGSPVTEADLISSSIIHNHLIPTGLPITGEEAPKVNYNIRKEWGLHWCVDPLDGTKEFIRKNGEFVVCIALIQHQHPILGIIASPVAKKMLVGGKTLNGAYTLNFNEVSLTKKWKKLPPLSPLNNPLVVISSRSHRDEKSQHFIKTLEQQKLNITTAQMGSALKFFDLAQGKIDIYPRFAPTMEWDIAAGHAIYEVLGGKIIAVDTNQPLKYNKENLVNPHFIICKPGVDW